MKNPVTAVKNSIKKNERRILITALVVTATTVVLLKMGLNQHDAFLKAHDLYTEFYTPEVD